jgi:hypothetical protein
VCLCENGDELLVSIKVRTFLTESLITSQGRLLTMESVRWSVSQSASQSVSKSVTDIHENLCTCFKKKFGKELSSRR